MRFVTLAAILFAAVLAACGGGDSATRYEVTVNFDTSVTQADLEEAGDILRAYDEDVDFVIRELFPPIGRATLETDASDFCAAIEGELEAKPYVREVSCGEWEEPDASESPDAPVQSDN